MKKRILVLLMAAISGTLFAQDKIIEKDNITFFHKDGPPLIHARLVFNLGNHYDKKGGEAYLLAKILSQSKLSDVLESNGTTIGCSADYDYFYIEYEVLEKYQKIAFEGAIDFLRNYRISDKEFLLAKTQLLQELKMQEDDYYDRVRFEFYKKLYGNHRYAVPNTGDVKSVEQISLEDMRSIYKQIINKNIFRLILVGAAKEKDLKFYTKAIKQMPALQIEPLKQEKLADTAQDETIAITAPITQVFVRIGTIGISRNHPEYLYYQLISDMVGGGFGSIIMKKLREEKGLTYSPGANFYALRKDKGYFFTAYSTRPENLDKSIAMVKDIFDNLSANGINIESFEISRRYIYGNLLQKEETNDSIAHFLMEAFIFGLKSNYWLEYKEKIPNLSYEKANQMVKDFFQNKKYVTVILKPQDK